jgi:hypothetical protein
MVRAKFYVSSIKKVGAMRSTDIGTVVEMLPVTSGSAENEQFYKWTPGGKLELATVNDEAAKQFEVGKEYYIDFTPANEQA